MNENRILSVALAGLLTLPLLTACGGDGAGGGSGDPKGLTDAGYASLGTSDFDGALSDFQKALAALEPGAPGFVRAAMGEVDALIHIDPGQARDKFLELARSYPDAIGSREFSTVGGKLTSEGKYTEAIDVLDAGLKIFTEDPKLIAVLAKVREAAEKAGDTSALKSLEGLGYL